MTDADFELLLDTEFPEESRRGSLNEKEMDAGFAAALDRLESPEAIVPGDEALMLLVPEIGGLGLNLASGEDEKSSLPEDDDGGILEGDLNAVDTEEARPPFLSSEAAVELGNC